MKNTNLITNNFNRREENKKDPSKLSFNYDFSLAISKCQQRLDRLRKTQDYLNFVNYKISLMPDYRNFLWPLRRPINPNPMLYAYQFLPPPLFEKNREIIKSTPVTHLPVDEGRKIPQENPDCRTNIFTLAKAMNRMLEKQRTEEELIERMRQDKKYRDELDKRMGYNVDD